MDLRIHNQVASCLDFNLSWDTSEPQPSTGETQEDMNNVSCRRDMTEILLKAA